MELKTEKRGKSLMIAANGRLDANWSGFFTDSFLDYIRKGEHHLTVDAREMQFLSSAGIRSLIQIHKELAKVEGSFNIINANDFVASTLQSTGLGGWLSKELPAAEKAGLSNGSTADKDSGNYYLLNKDAALELTINDVWLPWQKVKKDDIRQLAFPADSFALGIGKPLSDDKDTSNGFGEFMSVCGNLVYQSPDEKSRPDYLLPMENFVPGLLGIQSLYCQGEMSHLLRFAANDKKKAYAVSELASRALEVSRADMAAFVILGEIDGLVGAYMIKSPIEDDEMKDPDLNEMRSRLSFCGERAFSREQALIFGIVAKSDIAGGNILLKSLPSKPELSIHAHAAVFPYQPLQNGRIELQHQIHKFFNGPPPKAMMHLIDDMRKGPGLGESSLISGAMWCSPIKNQEENK